MKKPQYKHEWFAPLIVPCAFLLLWELVGQGRFALPNILAIVGFNKARIPDFSFLLPPSIVFPTFFRLFSSGDVLPYLWATTWRSCLGFLIAAALGFAFGIPLGLSKRFERLLLPTVDAMRSLPPVSLIPLLILFFGIDNGMKIVFISFGGFWPVVINTAQAVKAVDPMYIKVAFNAGHTARTILRRVILPAALPGTFAGFRVSLSICIILSIVCEMIVGNTGLGFFLNYSTRNLEYDRMFATLFVIAGLGWFLNVFIHWLDSQVLSWFYRSREAQMEYHHTWKF